MLGEFYVGELGGVFIFAVAGVGMMLLAGYTGLISLGNAAFLGIGAYTNSILLAQGVPLLITLPVCRPVHRSVRHPDRTADVAHERPVPCDRHTGIRQHRRHGVPEMGRGHRRLRRLPGADARHLRRPDRSATGIYYLSLAVLVFVLWLSANMLRTPLGRAMVAIRDSEISAQSMGIHLARYKTFAFAISACITGLAGALFAHYVRFLAPDAFDVLLSVQFVTIVFVGGLGSLHGVIFGAMFVRLLPQFIAIIRDDLPFGIGRMPGLEPSLFGLVLVMVILFEPGGIYGRWIKIKHWFQAYPLKRRSSFRRQKPTRIGAPAISLLPPPVMAGPSPAMTGGGSRLTAAAPSARTTFRPRKLARRFSG